MQGKQKEFEMAIMAFLALEGGEVRFSERREDMAQTIAIWFDLDKAYTEKIERHRVKSQGHRTFINDLQLARRKLKDKGFLEGGKGIDRDVWRLSYLGRIELAEMGPNAFAALANSSLEEFLAIHNKTTISLVLAESWGGYKTRLSDYYKQREELANTSEAKEFYNKKIEELEQRVEQIEPELKRTHSTSI